MEITRAREEAGMTQEALAYRAGVSLATIQRMEAGKTRRPHARVRHAVAEALGCDPEQFFTVHAPEPDTGSTGRGNANAKGRPSPPVNGGTAPTNGA